MNTSPRQSKDKDPLWSFNLVLVLLVTHFVFVNLSYQFTVVPRVIADRGGSEWQVGFIIGIAGIGSLVLRPWIGKYITRVGPKTATVFGVVLLALGSALYIPSAGPWFMILSRAVQALGMPLTTIATMTMVANIAPASRRGEAMAYSGIAIGSSSLYSPTFGFYLYDSFGATEAFLFGSCILGGINAMRIIKRDVVLQTTPSGEKVPLVSKAALFPTGVYLAHTITLAPISIFLPLLSDERDLGNPGTIFTVYSMTQIAVMFYSGRLSDRIGRAPLIAAGMVLTVASMAVLVPETNYLVFLSAGLLNGLGFGLIGPAIQAFTVDRVPPHERAAAMATLNTAWGLGNSGGGLLLGPAASAFGVASTFAISGGIATAGLAGFLAGISRRKPDRVRELTPVETDVGGDDGN